MEEHTTEQFFDCQDQSDAQTADPVVQTDSGAESADTKDCPAAVPVSSPDIPVVTTDHLSPEPQCADANDAANQADKLIEMATNEPGTSTPTEDEPPDKETPAPNDEWFIDEAYLMDLDKSEKPNKIEARKKAALAEKAKGNAMYQKNNFEQAARLYTNALRGAPLTIAEDRSIMYSNRGACFVKMELRDQAIDDCTKAIELKPSYIKPLMRRAALYEEKEDDWDKGLEDYNTVITIEPNNFAARTAIFRLNPMIQARNERMKEEMLGKLKDLGNMVLKPFGLSTNNFKMEENPEGGYSVKMQNTK